MSHINKRGLAKLYPILTVVFLLLSLLAGLALVQTRQNLYKEAADISDCQGYTPCKNNTQFYYLPGSTGECGAPMGCRLECKSDYVWKDDWYSECVPKSSVPPVCIEEMYHAPDGAINNTYIFYCNSLSCTTIDGVYAKRCDSSNSIAIRQSSGRIDDHCDLGELKDDGKRYINDIWCKCLAYQVDWMDNDHNVGWKMGEAELSGPECYYSAITPTPNPTKTPIPTATPTRITIPSPTPTRITSPTPTKIPIPTNTPTPTKTPIPTKTPTGTLVPTQTPTNTPIPTKTPTPTNTPRPQDTPTSTPIPTRAIAEGPAPTRIQLPEAGVDFPFKGLFLGGAIVALLGLLVLL